MTLEPVKACGWKDWEVENQPPHFLPKRHRSVEWERVGWYVGGHMTRVLLGDVPYPTPLDKHPPLTRNAPSNQPCLRVFRATVREREINEGALADEKRDFRNRRTPDTYRARGERGGLHDAVHCATTCVGAVGERSHEPVARRVTRGAVLEVVSMRERRFCEQITKSAGSGI